MKEHVRNLLKFANIFADVSNNILKKKYLKPHKVEEKNDGSFVTNADKEIESKFRESLKKNFPGHGIVGEEFGSENEQNEYVWVIDPLDGTHNFIAGKPLFGTLICCIKHGRPILGVIDIPILDERWHGGKGVGVKLNSRKCKNFSQKKQYSQLIVASTSLLMFDENYEKKIKEIYKKVSIRIFGSDCYSYGLLLSGRVDQIIEADMKPWDFLAQVALINEQGGIITDWHGKELNLSSDGKIIASIEKNHHKRTLEYLKK